MYDAWVGGDRERALDLHYGLHPLVDLMFVETNPAPIKHVLAQGGLIASGHVRPPLVEPTPAGIAAIERLAVEGGACCTSRSIDWRRARQDVLDDGHRPRSPQRRSGAAGRALGDAPLHRRRTTSTASTAR